MLIARGIPTQIDYDRARESPRPHNVTQLCQFLTAGRYAHLLAERDISEEIKEHLNRKQITVITGMRRTGKTTLVQWLLEQIPSKNKLYIDLERIDNRELFTIKNYDAVIPSLQRRGIVFTQKVTLALDEIQLVPNITSVLKYLYDTYDIKFIVTGSSSYYLKNLFSESLAGRKKIFELFPLSFGEFLLFKNVTRQKESSLHSLFLSDEYERLSKYYEEYIKFGGFPEAVLAKTMEEKKDVIADIISSYLNIDIKALADFRSQHDVYSLMKMLASRAGSRWCGRARRGPRGPGPGARSGGARRAR